MMVLWTTGGSDGRRTRRLFRVEDLPGSQPWAWRSGFAEGRCVTSNMKGVVAVADDDGLELRTGAGEARGAFRGVAYDAAAMAFLADGQRLVTAARARARPSSGTRRSTVSLRRRERGAAYLLRRWRSGRGSRWTGTGPSKHIQSESSSVRQYDLPTISFGDSTRNARASRGSARPLSARGGCGRRPACAATSCRLAAAGGLHVEDGPWSGRMPARP